MTNPVTAGKKWNTNHVEVLTKSGDVGLYGHRGQHQGLYGNTQKVRKIRKVWLFNAKPDTLGKT
jgi:hypothetical protein